jgi:hypothetical protein
MRVPAAPPAPEGAEQAVTATRASGRSRRSWEGLWQPEAVLQERGTNVAPEQGLTIRPIRGYSWRTTHMSALLAEL